MGLRGPQPLPTAILKLRGSRRAKARAAREPAIDAGAPELLDALTAEESAEWARLVAHLAVLGVTTLVDGRALARLCRDAVWMRRLVEARTACDDVEAAIWIDRRIDAVAARMLAIEREYGLTPSARTRVRPAAKPVAEASPAAKYFGGNGA